MVANAPDIRQGWNDRYIAGIALMFDLAISTTVYTPLKRE